MIDLTFVDEPPPPATSGRPPEALPFVEQLRLNPGRWARYPKQTRQRATMARYKARFPDVEWRQTREGELYTIYARCS